MHETFVDSLLEVTPEMLFSEGFSKIVHRLNEREQLNRLVVDEAHCISVRQRYLHRMITHRLS